VSRPLPIVGAVLLASCLYRPPVVHPVVYPDVASLAVEDPAPPRSATYPTVEPFLASRLQVLPARVRLLADPQGLALTTTMVARGPAGRTDVVTFFEQPGGLRIRHLRLGVYDVQMTRETWADRGWMARLVHRCAPVAPLRAVKADPWLHLDYDLARGVGRHTVVSAVDAGDRCRNDVAAITSPHTRLWR